jgi:hypothetical protein
MELGFDLRAFALVKRVLYHLSYTFGLFGSGYFGDGILGTICLVWHGTVIFLMSASQVARIIGVSHQYPAVKEIFA